MFVLLVIAATTVVLNDDDRTNPADFAAGYGIQIGEENISFENGIRVSVVLFRMNF